MQDSEFVDTNGDSYGLGWLDYGARMSDPAIGRWHVVDPKSEKFYNVNTYNYVLNSPILAIDEKGEHPIFIHGTYSNPSAFTTEFIELMISATGWDNLTFGNKHLSFPW